MNDPLAVHIKSQQSNNHVYSKEFIFYRESAIHEILSDSGVDETGGKKFQFKKCTNVWRGKEEAAAA
jgi:hypothetical protein